MGSLGGSAGKAKELKVDNFAASGKGSNNANKGEGHERNASLHEVNHMDDAVELSSTGYSRGETSTAGSLKESHEICNCATEEIPEIDSLSESEDLRMEDAFQDVGLSACDSGDLHFEDLSLSHVKDTFASQTQRCSGKLEKKGAVLHGIDSLQPGDGFAKLSSNDIESINVTLFLQKVNFPVLEGNSFQASIGSPTVENINIAGEGDELPKVVPRRFESRWFGGWTCLKKEVNPSDQVKCNAIKSVPEPFVGETSYFSESADIAPDESSFVAQKQDERVNVSSQLSIPSEGLRNKAKENDTALSGYCDIFKSILR
ncbi:hypothetical protein K7X08_025198 [Anisodus acutangulus]|uniref:Uncharacterized protein n=1 Tax=Anisodus acutangulus TaxID=402998 RepID=A0A9Q1M9A2_9SOLA|nr:hypothetical protein K7X08_025198 [Anisodus acutangulus]